MGYLARNFEKRTDPRLMVRMQVGSSGVCWIITLTKLNQL